MWVCSDRSFVSCFQRHFYCDEWPSLVPQVQFSGSAIRPSELTNVTASDPEWLLSWTEWKRKNGCRSPLLRRKITVGVEKLLSICSFGKIPRTYLLVETREKTWCWEFLHNGSSDWPLIGSRSVMGHVPAFLLTGNTLATEENTEHWFTLTIWLHAAGGQFSFCRSTVVATATAPRGVLVHWYTAPHTLLFWCCWCFGTVRCPTPLIRALRHQIMSRLATSSSILRHLIILWNKF